jgi:heat shock protein HslJ
MWTLDSMDCHRAFLARLVAAGAVLSVFGCAPGVQTHSAPPLRTAARTIGYLCPDQSGFQVSIPADGASVKIDGLPAGPVTLPIAPSGSGARYTDGTTTFWSKGAEALLERPGQASRTCTVVADPAALPGSRWRLVRLESGDGTTAVPADASRYTLEFAADGTLSGQADCNRFQGRWTVAGTSLTLGPLAMTRAMCPPGSLSDRYARGLESAVSWRVVADRLAVALKVDSGILHFERMP